MGSKGRGLAADLDEGLTRAYALSTGLRTGGAPTSSASSPDPSASGTAKMVRQSRHVQHVSRWIQVPCSNTPEEISDVDPHSEHTICSLTRTASAGRASPIKPTEVE